MNRRNFCFNAVAAAVAVALPNISPKNFLQPEPNYADLEMRTLSWYAKEYGGEFQRHARVFPYQRHALNYVIQGSNAHIAIDRHIGKALANKHFEQIQCYLHAANA